MTSFTIAAVLLLVFAKPTIRQSHAQTNMNMTVIINFAIDLGLQTTTTAPAATDGYNCSSAAQCQSGICQNHDTGERFGMTTGKYKMMCGLLPDGYACTSAADCQSGVCMIHDIGEWSGTFKGIIGIMCGLKPDGVQCIDQSECTSQVCTHYQLKAAADAPLDVQMWSFCGLTVDGYPCTVDDECRSSVCALHDIGEPWGTPIGQTELQCGKVRNGDHCEDDAQCRGGACRMGELYLGQKNLGVVWPICVKLLEAGHICYDDSECQSGLCDATMSRCTSIELTCVSNADCAQFDDYGCFAAPWLNSTLKKCYPLKRGDLTCSINEECLSNVCENEMCTAPVCRYDEFTSYEKSCQSGYCHCRGLDTRFSGEIFSEFMNGYQAAVGVDSCLTNQFLPLEVDRTYGCTRPIGTGIQEGTWQQGDAAKLDGK